MKKIARLLNGGTEQDAREFVYFAIGGAIITFLLSGGSVQLANMAARHF